MLRIFIIILISLFFTSVHAKPTDASTKDTADTSKKDVTSKKPTKTSEKDGITKISDNKWEIKKKLMKRWKKKSRKFAKGKLKRKKGFIIKKLRDAKYCGFQVGDVIYKINKNRVTSITEALMAQSALSKAKKLVVKFRRNKKKMIHTYIIVE
jgi:hypothetical protein